MSDSDPVEIVQAWVVAANAQDIEGLLALSDPDIEVAGPRGAGRGQQLLRDWLARAGLSLQTLRVFAAADAVVLDQRGTWRSRESGEVTGDMAVASAFRVRDGHVTWFARFDHVDAALTAAGLHPSDERRASGGR